ncbi:4-hydroxyphenylacetate 3-monooxygenase [Hyphomicrobiales bacterium]|nr:4-hydroxyphenylacetate 3-monooxygenase [Hyphomicrobiales bacterium]CAH1671533.1 4-hydroxyphenylacetate 3-monooxygenase [Hyphomicrobiales bacterium]
MLRSGKEYLDSIRDGRTIYVGRERIEDVTVHPAFRDAAGTYAALFDFKAAPENRDVMSFEENGDRFSMYYLQPRSLEDLRRRSKAHRKIADFCFGLMGRTPDAVAGNVSGLAMNSAYIDKEAGGNGANVRRIYEHMRSNDIFATYAIVPPPAARNKDYYQSSGVQQPALRVTGETDRGVILNGMKMLATSAAYANEVLIGNVMPLAPDQKKESITCVIPLNLPGLSLWARRPFNRSDMIEFDNPLTKRFDESDCMLLFRDVEVPWERVIVHDNPELSRNIYINTPAHVMANHQCTVRFASKLRFLIGVASLVTKATGARDIPSVKEILGRLGAYEAGFSAMIDGQLEAYQPVNDGYVLFNRRYLYAALHWAMENHSQIIDTLRELMGGGHFQFPASIDIMEDPELKETFETFWAAGQHGAVDRMKLFKLAWDLVGSDHASRATSYEKFFVGPAFAVRNYNFIYTPWDELHAIAEGLMGRYGPPEAEAGSTTA